MGKTHHNKNPVSSPVPIPATQLPNSIREKFDVKSLYNLTALIEKYKKKMTIIIMIVVENNDINVNSILLAIY